MIDIVQAAEHGFPDDHPILRVAAWRFDRAWGTLTDRAMGMPAIEISHIFRQHPDAPVGFVNSRPWPPAP